MARLCLISPGHLATNPRLVKEANALVQAGHQVWVISGRYLPWAIEQDKWLLHEQCRWGPALAFGPHAPLRTRIRQVLTHKLAQLLIRMGVKQPWLSELAWHPLVPDLKAAAKKMRADLYIAHYPAALPAAASAAAAHSSHYAFDAEDFHLGDYSEDASHEPERQLLRRIESRYLPGCSFITASSPGIASAYAETYGLAAPVVIRNMFPRSQAPPGPTASGTAEPGPSLYWFSQTIGPDRGLECAIAALALTRSRPHLYLRGFIRADYRQSLYQLAEEHGVHDQLHLLPPAPPQQMERLAASHDLGLVAETGLTLNRRIALTNKLFTYALAGVPALVSDIPAHRQIIQEASGCLHLFRADDPSSLATVVDAVLTSTPSHQQAAREAMFRLAQEHWNWEREQQLLLACIEAVLADGSNSIPQVQR